MKNLRIHAATAVLTLGLVASVLAGPVATAGAADQAATLRVLPPIAHTSASVAATDRARTAVTATFVPAAAGRPVALQRLVGRRWREVARTTQTATGLAEFSVPTRTDGVAETFRVSASAWQDYPAYSSPTAVSGTHGAPDFREEFNGTTLGPRWSQRGQDYNPAGLRNCAKGDPRAVQVSAGAVRLSVLTDPDRVAERCTARRANGETIGQFNYRLNGHISTQPQDNGQGFAFTHGIAAARVKFPERRGQHGAFWMQPVSRVPPATDAASGGAEIDVVEYFGDNGTGQGGGVQSCIYYPTPGGTVKAGGFIPGYERFMSGPDDRWYRNYHVFSVEWTPTEYVMRIDGRETWRTTEGVSGRPEYPILSLLSSDYELPNLGGEQFLPQHMFVDWVQVWAS